MGWGETRGCVIKLPSRPRRTDSGVDGHEQATMLPRRNGWPRARADIQAGGREYQLGVGGERLMEVSVALERCSCGNT